MAQEEAWRWGLLQGVIFGLHQEQATKQQIREFLADKPRFQMAMLLMEEDRDLWEQAQGKGRGGKGIGKGTGKVRGKGKGKGKFEF